MDDWWHHKLAVQRRYTERYVDADGHRHIHGANLGVSAAVLTVSAVVESYSLLVATRAVAAGAAAAGLSFSE